MSTERKTAPNALWAYLLQNNLPASSDFAATPMIPAMTPVDRTNTSMRMLIHDMQATLEKFSTRVDTLLIHIKEAKTEVVNCNRISEGERERVLDEISNSSKKVQTELKACIGAPSQASSLELIQKSQSSTESSIQALDKRIDAIQTAVIAQLIQSQNHAMQAIQDQQHSILTAVLPLLPLVQAFPLHADQVKTSIADNVLSTISSLSRDIDSMKSTLSGLSLPSDSIQSVLKSAIAAPPSLAENHPTRKRTNSWLNQDDAHSRRSQSSRPHSVASAMGSPRIDHHKKPRLDGVLPTASPRLVKPHTANSPAKRAPNLRASLTADGLTSPACGSFTSSGYTAAPRPENTTRVPLADILPPLVNHTTIQFQKPVAESSSSGPGVNLPTKMHASSQSGRLPLPSVRAHEAISPASTAAPLSSNISTTTAPKPDNIVPPTANQDRTKTPESVPIPPRPIPKVIKLEEVLRSPLKCYISIPPSPLSSLSPSPNPVPAVLKTQVQHATVARRQVTFATSNQALTSSTRPSPSVLSLPTHNSMSASMSLRDRRAQMSMLGRTASSAKRFIPLGSSSDEES